ncbi:MAG: hypothetical protein IKU55_06000, partial [Clostridia bacterium]|nr:hypothetical protein [Clostridia bacterium]
MKRETLQDAIGMVDDDLVARASQAPKGKKTTKWIRWSAPIAAVLAIAIALGYFFGRGNPLIVDAYALAKAEYPTAAIYPTEPTDWTEEADAEFSAQYKAWRAEEKERRALAEDELALAPFMKTTIPQILAGDIGENRVYSPINLYMALSMLAEISDGESREEILDLLGTENLSALRKTVEAAWKANYQNDGSNTSILASSLWLDSGLEYVEGTVRRLAEDYYASVYQGEMGSEDYNAAYRDWLNAQTGGLLGEAVEQSELSAETVMALATTIFYRVNWEEKFDAMNTIDGVFHALSGDQTCEFMQNTLFYGQYFWGSQFTATANLLATGGQMLLILPDEGVELQDLLKDAEVSEFMTSYATWANNQTLMVNLAMPKFDVGARTDLSDVLKELGVSACFDIDRADFSPILRDDAAVSAINHAVRVAVDEDGVAAAAYTEIAMAGG